MAILVVGGYTVPVKGPDSIQQHDDEIGGSRVRMFSGLMRATVRGYKRTWNVATRLLSASERTSFYSAMRGTPPVACSGDAVGGSTVNCFQQITSDQQQWVKGQTKYVISFTLFEA